MATARPRWEFAETAPISTYLTALVAGDYHRVEQSYRAAAGELPMAILCRQSLAEHLDADRIFRITPDGFGVFERHFAFPYPFGKYDQVFVPEYNGGAMENVGCVTVRDEYVFRSRATPAAYVARDDTLLHELSHMWFGDLVTMRWWDDLWLKESFATWASNFASSELADDPATAWASFTNGFKSWAYRQDQLPSTHPIAADMVDLEAVEQNFDGITYSKGASVLVQLVAFVGRDAFLAGLRRYFAEHAYGNTELADLLRALESASGRDLSSWSAQWLETTGVNTLRADFALAADGTFERFAVQQSADSRAPHPARPPDRDRAVRRSRSTRRTGPAPHRPGRDRHRRSQHGHRRTRRSAAARSRAAQRRRPELRQGPPRPALTRHRDRRAVTAGESAGPCGVLGLDLGHVPGRGAAGRRTTSTWRCAEWRPSPTTRPCSRCSGRRPARSATTVRPLPARRCSCAGSRD